MAIADLTITNEELEGKKISDIVGDTLAGTPAENKQKFDDYSDVLKEKFNDLIDELVNLSPQNNVLEGVQVNGIDLTVSGKKVNIPLVASSNDGAMSIADKTKLDGLNKTFSVTSGGTGIPTSGAVYSAIQSVAGIASDTADYVVSYEENVEAADISGGFAPLWRVRKWNSGLCEMWCKFTTDWSDMASNAKKALGSMYVLNVGEDDDLAVTPSFEGIYYPSNTFNSVPFIEELRIIENITGSIGSYLTPVGYPSNTILKTRTHDYHLVCPRAINAKFNVKISAYIVGRWK